MESWSSRLGAAAFNGDVEDLKLCIENGANPEYRGYKGGTALMSAARQGHLDITHFLITNGCKKDASDTHGRKALHLAAYHGHLNVVRYLVEHVGISPLIKTNKGETPYDSAAISEAQGLRGIESFNRLIHPEGGPVDKVTVMPPRDVKEYLQTIMSKQDEDVQGSSTPTEDTLPDEIKLMSDKKSIPMYLKLLESGSEKKRDIRLVIVGKKGSGKTSLVKRLFEEDTGEVTSTNGIDIHRIRCRANTDDGIWNKLEGINDETDTNARLFKPYVETLKNRNKKSIGTPVQEAIHVAPPVFTEPKVTTPGAMKPKVTTPGATKPNVTTPGDTKPKVTTPGGAKPKVTTPVYSYNELQLNVLSDQFKRDTKNVMKSKVDLYDKEEYATLLLWDFAGDEEFYHTHQTFLSPDSIYLVVAKLNEAEDKQAKDLFRLWMDSIHCYSRLEGDISSTDDMETTCDVLDPPVVIVGTWKDALTSESDEIQDVCRKNILLYTKHMAEDERGHIRGEVFVSNTTDDKRVFQKIRQNILKVARTMRTWNKDYPLKFIQLEKSLHEKKKELPIIPFKKLEHIAEKTPMPFNGEELILYLKYHHKIRALVYFEDLPDHIILDTQWLSNAFKCIVTARPFRNESIRNQKRWEEFSSRGKLHSVVLEDILKEKQNLLFKHNKDHILKLMEKFDIIIRPDKSDEQVCYYVPCMIKAEPECGIYQMLNVTGDTCLKSTWMCFKFKFLPPHLMNHLIASLSRKYDVAEVRFTKEKQTERVFALFKGTAVFELDKATKLSKLLVTTIPNSIQIQILEFGKSAVFKKGMYGYINDFVTAEINKIIRRRFRMTNVHFTKKWECGLTSLDDVTGSNKFSEDQHTEYFCETCIRTHEWTNEWSDLQSKELSMSKNSQEVIRSNNQKETTSKTKAFPTKEEINFVKMAMIVLNVLTDALYDLLKQDKSNLRPRSDCDFTYLYDELRALNKHIPSKRWGGTWQNILTINIHIAVGDDIERIRLTRNELQHSRTFILDDKRFNELHNIVVDIVKRFDQHIKPARLYTDNLIESFAKTFSADEVEALQEQIENEIQGFDRLFKIPFSFGLELIIDKRLDDKYSKLIQSNNIDNEGENSMMKEFVHICEWRKTYVKPMPPSVNLLIDAIRNGKDLRGRWLLSNFDFESYMWDVFQNILEVGNIRMAKALAWIITNKLFTKYKHTLSLKKFRIWPGFHCICKKKDIFRICSDQFEIIIESMETNQDIPDEFLGFKVRHLSYEKESKEAQNVQDCLSKHWKPEACCDNIVIPGKDAESVFNNHSNLSLICSSVLRSAGILDNHRIYNERCIQLYCTVKGMIPVGEKHFPSSICQYSTDVLEGCPLLATTVIKVGEKVGTLDSTGNYKSQGTLGGFIYHLGFQCFLTCAHVVFDLETLLGRIPSAIDRSGINVFMSEPTNNTLVNCGSVIRRVFDHSDKDKTSIDAALIMIKSAVKLDPNNIIDGFESSRSLTDLGLSSEDLKDICIDISSICDRPAEILCPGGFNKINQTVTVNHPEDYVELQFPPVGGQPQQGHSQPLMVGTTAHMQLSNTNLNGQRVFRMYNQLLLNIPLNLGDSGTCIYVMDLNKKTYCLGMAIAFLPFGQSIVTPLKEILKKFNQ